jgi:hypothetical protein
MVLAFIPFCAFSQNNFVTINWFYTGTSPDSYNAGIDSSLYKSGHMSIKIEARPEILILRNN